MTDTVAPTPEITVEPDPEPEIRVARRSRAHVWAPRVFLAALFGRILAVDIAGVVTNDSIGYFTRAADPFGAGFVSQGYRQAAYPLFVSISDVIADIGGWDRIFGLALVQRTSLLVAVAMCWWALRWWSAPLLLFVSAPTYVVHTDFLITEGMLIPLSLAAASLGAAVVLRRSFVVERPQVALIASVVIGAVAASFKLQYASLLLFSSAAAWLLWRDGLVARRRAIGVVASGFVFVLALATVQSFENRSELGVFEPVSERARAEWYGAWQAIFTLQPENYQEPALTEYLAEGNLYTFLHGIEAAEPDYEIRAEAIRERVELMFEAAGTTARAQQIDAALGALRGGRIDDLAGLVNRALAATPGDDGAGRVGANGVFGRAGEQAVLDGVNDGRATGVLSVGVVLEPLSRPLDDHRPVKGEFAVVGLVLALIGVAVPGRQRVMCAAGAALALAVAVALGSAYIDNARYLLGPLTTVVVAGTLGARGLALFVHDRVGRSGTNERQPA